MGDVTASRILTLPRLGETMEEARVTDWLVAPGAAFARGDVLLEVETDKTVVEVPALRAGVMVAHLVAVGDTVALDQPIAEVAGPGSSAVGGSVNSADAGAMPAQDAAGAVATGAAVTPQDCSDARRPDPTTRAATSSDGPGLPETSVGIATPADHRPAASPRARADARCAGIALQGLPGTGRHGRITGDDVARHLAADGPKDASRPAVMLLHGLFDDSRRWRDLPDRLRRAGHTVVVPDLPGHGSNAAVAGSLDEAAEHLLARVPDGPLHLVGHSLGAVLAVRLAQRLGSRAVHLTLIAPAGLGARMNGDFFDLMRHAATPAALARALALLGTGPVSDTALSAMLTALLARRSDVAALADALERGGIQQTDIAGDLAATDVPVTAVFGLADAILDWRCCAELPARAAIHLIAGAGHLPHAHDPGLVAGLIACASPVRAEGG